MLKRLHFKSSVVLVQILLLLPPITLIALFIMYRANESVMAELDSSRNHTLQTVGNAFDQTYERTLKLLQTPYTDRTIYNILTTSYGESPQDTMQKHADAQFVPRLLSNTILYYEPNISSVTLLSEISESLYYKWSYPTISVNVHNPDWFDLFQSEWYKTVIAVDEPVISSAMENELYIGNGLILSFSQRLKDVMQDRRIGAIRIDLNLSTFHDNWGRIVENPRDIFFVLDQSGNVVFSSDLSFEEAHPFLLPEDIHSLQNGYRVNSYTAPASGFTFAYLTNTSVSESNLRLLYGLPLVIVAICVLYASLFISWSSRYISRPVHKLKTAMVQGQQKDLTARCEPLKGEMGELSDAFNDLMGRMGELVDEATTGEQEKAQLTYEMLLSKFSPHFLYNTLSAIQFKADLTGSRDVAHALESLSSLLRFSIKCTDEIIPFKTELEQLEHYVEIMRVRYGNEIDMVYDIDDECFQYRCLKFLIQPTVENSFIHAFADADREEDKQIAVSVICEQHHIRVIVEDNGKGMTQQQMDELFIEKETREKSMFTGIGVGNVRQRLIASFGADCEFYFESEPGLYTRAVAVIPKISIGGSC